MPRKTPECFNGHPWETPSCPHRTPGLLSTSISLAASFGSHIHQPCRAAMAGIGRALHDLSTHGLPFDFIDVGHLLEGCSGLLLAKKAQPPFAQKESTVGSVANEGSHCMAKDEQTRSQICPRRSQNPNERITCIGVTMLTSQTSAADEQHIPAPSPGIARTHCCSPSPAVVQRSSERRGPEFSRLRVQHEKREGV